jgi:hypothetical protein
VTGGRTRPEQDLLPETLISVPQHDPELSKSLLPESRALYERAREKMSVADLAAATAIPLNVVTVLLGDLAEHGAVVVHPAGDAYQYDVPTLVRILDRLENLSG